VPINPNCYVIGVLGGKGGVGKSVFAANFALAYMIELKAQTLLIDLDANSGADQDIILGVRSIKTISELAAYSGQINVQTIPTLVARHPSGLMFVGAVKSPSERLNCEPDLVIRQIESLSRSFNCIVVDLGSELGALQRAVAELCTVLCVVTTAEVLAVNQTVRLVNELATAAFPSDMVQIVVNKSGQMGLSPQKIGQSLRRNVFSVIPQDDVTVNMSIQNYQPFVISSPKSPVSSAYHETVRRLTGGILQRLVSIQKPKGTFASQGSAVASTSSVTSAGGIKNSLAPPGRKLDEKTLLKLQIHGELFNQMDLKKGITDTKGDVEKEKSLRAKTQQKISEILDVQKQGLPREERAKIIKEVLDEALGLGPLEELLADDMVTEIMVNGCDKIYIEKSGKKSLSQTTFTSNQQLRNVIDRIVSPLGRQINDSSPYVDARLKDGSRVHAIIEPLSIDGPTVTIRKFAKDPVTIDHYIKWGTASKQILDFLRICVENGINVVISGGTGSGKTTLLNVLSSFIPKTERIITVEDAAELQLKQEHVVRLETKPPNMEGKGAVTIRDLIRNTLRMAPNRIIVGECRDGAAFDMLTAMNTGHDGSMTTIHANNPTEALSRIETLCMMAGMDLPAKAIRQQIAGAVGLIVQIGRLSDGSRKIKYLTEIVGMQGGDDKITAQDIFVFKETGYDKNRKVNGYFMATGAIPNFLQKLKAKGVDVATDLFSSSAPTGQDQGGTVTSPPPPLKKVGG